MKVITTPDPRLRKKSTKVSVIDDEVHGIIAKMTKSSIDWENEHPYELTTAMAFNYFAEQNVEVAIIEVGLGGRLDCTNIITPELCIITNISPDHTQFLGNTLQEIASEKAGIIKNGIPVVIGETTRETKEVFARKAKESNAPIIFAEEEALLTAATPMDNGYRYSSTVFGEFCGELGGDYQQKNTNTLLSAINILRNSGFAITEESLRKGFTNVCKLTGLMGRWQKIQDNPRVICDAGHNIGGIKYITEQLARVDCRELRIVFGMVNDKDITSVLKMMPRNAEYYFTQASIKRAMPADDLKNMAERFGLMGNSHPNVKEALEAALSDSSDDDFIFVGGSCFIVADLLVALKKQ